ncbi:hypothetical protein EH2_00580 [Bacillus subtilis]|nr:hypothetical protein EH2_00580 [Bacillus subtilis]
MQSIPHQTVLFIMAEAEMAILKKQPYRLKRRRSGIPLLTSI